MITLNLFSLMSPRKVSSCAKPSGLAQLAEPAAFFSAAGCRNDFGAQVFADLNGGDADAAAAGLDQQPVTRFYFAVFHQAEPCVRKTVGTAAAVAASTPSGTERISAALAVAYSA